MNPRAAQTNFSKGELAPQLYGRFDVDAWQGAVKEARNVFILKYGGLSKRPGLRFVAEVLDDSEEQLLFPFEFSLNQTYVLEFGQGYAAPLALGGRVIEEELEIAAITSANPAQITAAFHGYVAGDQVYISGIEGELGNLLNGRLWPVLASVDDNNFTIDADTTGLAAFTAAEGGVVRDEAPVAPTPPVVPPPVEPPPPPDVIGGGGGDFRDPPGLENLP